MPGRKNELISLLKKYRLGKASAEEVSFLEKYYQYFDKEEKISQQFSETEKEELGKKMFSAVQSQMHLAPVIPLVKRTWFRLAAAVILVLVTAGVYYILNNDYENKSITKTEPQETRFKNDVAAPAGTKARITLADGRTVSIDSLTTLTQNGVSVTKTTDGKIIYDGSAKEMVYNTLSNPRGSKVIDMTLADGSHVWLNAGSSVTYPVAFIGNERKISITGEAYFEVAHNTAMPFKVSKGEIDVTVLGTHFNVNAYDDEVNMKVTLLQGSVQVNKGNGNSLLKPGQQATISNSPLGDGGITVHSNVDLDEVMAWKNGVFKFKDATIELLMRQVEKWYDVEIVYEGKISNHFVATIPRNVTVANVFRILEETGGVHFKIDGKKVTVMP